MSTVLGKTVKLFFEQGNHDGIISAEMMNWTGIVIVCPRTSLSEIYNLKHIYGAGIYFLISEEDNLVYVGETMNGVKRIKSHDFKKDFWDKLVIVQTTDTNLTKTHCSYLEHRCAQIIEKDSMFKLENGRGLSDYTGTLTRSSVNDMEVFLDNLQFILPAMGINILKKLATIKNDKKVKAEFVLSVKGVKGEVYLQDDQIILKKGSIGNKGVKSSLYETLKTKREMLIEKGILKVVDNHIEVQEDFNASSLSTAACYLTGYPISGPQNWKLKDSGITYKKWEQEQIKKKR
jgi:hypothetical protein